MELHGRSNQVIVQVHVYYQSHSNGKHCLFLRTTQRNTIGRYIMNYDYSFGLSDITNDIQTLSFNESLTNKTHYSNHLFLIWKERHADLNIYSKQIYNYFHNTNSTWIGGGGIIVNHFVLSGIEGRNYVIMSKV